MGAPSPRRTWTRVDYKPYITCSRFHPNFHRKHHCLWLHNKASMECQTLRSLDTKNLHKSHVGIMKKNLTSEKRCTKPNPKGSLLVKLFKPNSKKSLVLYGLTLGL
ncbi:hypothetical protein Hanom_Chr13g01235821 [Helianthus anomalus]